MDINFKPPLIYLIILVVLSLYACDSTKSSRSTVADVPTSRFTKTPATDSNQSTKEENELPVIKTAQEQIIMTKTPSPSPVDSQPGQADADVTFVRAVQSADGTWTFHVTVEHPDTGWEDYANGWDVVTPDGQVLKPNPDDPFTRLLLHPHENEQPFTRSQRDIEIPALVTQVTIRAHDIVDGFGGQEILVDLTLDSGPGFEVDRQD